MKRIQGNIQATGENALPEARLASLNPIFAVGDTFCAVEAEIERAVFGEALESLPGFVRRGMYIENCQRTREILLAPSLGWVGRTK